MAIAEIELRELQKQVSKLQTDVEQLQERISLFEQDQKQPTAPLPALSRDLSERERAIQLLKRAGLVSELPPEAKRLAAEWRALSPEEKKEVEDELRSVRIDPPLSQIIHDMRG